MSYLEKKCKRYMQSAYGYMWRHITWKKNRNL